MRTAVLANGQALQIEDASGTVIDDFGYAWVSVKGEQKAWHFRVPPNMRHTLEEYEKELAQVEYNNQMSQWHIDTQNMLQKLWPKGVQEFSLDGSRRADFMIGNRIFEAQYSDMSDDEPYDRTSYWALKGYDVTWILAPHILNQLKYAPRHSWHGEAFSTANFSIKNLNKWLKPLEIKDTVVLTTLPLFEWGLNVEVRKDARDHQDREGEPCIYRFYNAEYNEKYKNWKVYGGCTYNWYRALVKVQAGRMY